ncbi:translation initiation factor IF-2 N-terminal domain-containing protein, partial [Staphylococcus haemolyticus]
MSKKRIYEYAKELNVKSKEIIDELKNMNVEVSNHMQALEDDQIKTLDKKFRQQESNNNTKQNTQNNHQKQQNNNNNKNNNKQSN